MTQEQKKYNALRSYLKEVGDYPSVGKFLDEYANVKTQAAYAQQLAFYLR